MYCMQRRLSESGHLIPALKSEDLYALKDITFVSGFVNIEGGFISPSKSLDFLSNLEYIGGRGSHHGYTLQILANNEIEYLGFKSLKQITSGHVVIKLNAKLCYGYTINWKKFMTKDFNIIYERNTPNHTCVDKGRICNETCVQEEGCWGPGPKMCVQCKNFIKDDECANHCPIENGLVSVKNTERKEKKGLFVGPQSSIRSFARSSIRSFARSFIRSFVHSSVNSFVSSSIRSFVYLFIRSFIRLFVR
uniref:Receptor protein-tyrosine kinase n=1 Tax=Acrobeloides nanus TaxID=290746 RepID=A0A914E3M9_9BILA